MTDEPKLSASWLSQAGIAARAIRSLFRRAPKKVSILSPDSTIISSDTQREHRVPPGQVRTKRWPVLHVGQTPTANLATWRFTLCGLIAEEKLLTWDEFRSLPVSRVHADMHCVTRWSMLDNLWEGVLVADLMKLVTIKPEAKFVEVRAQCGYRTNLSLDDFLADDCLFAWSHNGEPLEPDHGWPLRLVIPRLYAWKSAKWVRGVEFLAEDRPGFWEENGYHNHGDPWTEERFW